MSDDLVGNYMTTDVLVLHVSDPVPDAVSALVDHGVDGAPVVDASGRVIGMLSASDLMVQDANLHLPTIVALFGVTVELPLSTRRFDRDVRQALASTVAELMHGSPITIGVDATVRDAATLMHEHHVSRLAVVDDAGQLAGIIAQGDVLRYLVRVNPDKGSGADPAVGPVGEPDEAPTSGDGGS